MFLWGHTVAQLVGESTCVSTPTARIGCSFPKGHTCRKYFENIVFVSRSLGTYCTTYCLKNIDLADITTGEAGLNAVLHPSIL